MKGQLRGKNIQLEVPAHSLAVVAVRRVTLGIYEYS